MSEKIYSPVALAGNPNCGKSALFNALTGGHAKVANYPGVTVEIKEGIIKGLSGSNFLLLDLPGTYSLDARTPDEEITRDVLCGKSGEIHRPELIIAVADATHLERSLGLVLELKALNLPMVLAINMMDLGEEAGLRLNLPVLSQELGMPVVPTVAIQNEGASEILRFIETMCQTPAVVNLRGPDVLAVSSPKEIRDRFKRVDQILQSSIEKPLLMTDWTDQIDRFVLHPILGPILLLFVLMVVFEAIFSCAQIPMQWMEGGVEAIAFFVQGLMQDGPLRSLLCSGIIPGVGSILIFLPQILFLFLFLMILEDSGYMSRAAFLMDRMMGRVGLHGKAFIPLLSSFACAIPGIMATRTIENKRDRLTTILIAPLMACSARLPVYTLLIAAFIPDRAVLRFFHLQSIVMLGLYFLGVVAALLIALVFRKSFLRGPRPSLLMELPTYKWPSVKNIGIGLTDQVHLFIKKAGSVILTVSILLWFFASYPHAPSYATEPAVSYSYAGIIGKWLEPLVKPIGFDWRIAVALIPGFTAREVMIGALATVYSVATEGKDTGIALTEKLSQSWSVATGLSLLVWYVFACQCLSTLAVTRRETKTWRWPAVMLGYMTLLAYAASWVTYHAAVRLGLG